MLHIILQQFQRHLLPHGDPPRRSFGNLISGLYTVLPSLGRKSVSDKSSSILFADDTSFIIANHNETEFKFKTNEIFNEINKWFHSNKLMLNYEKTYFFTIFN